MAVAAIAASLLLARSLDEGEGEGLRMRLASPGEGQPARQLDAIRAAGL